MMYGQGMYGAAPVYGMYGYDPRAAAEAARGRAPEREATPVKFTEGKLFIGGVEAQLISKDDLVQYCSRWGEVADAVVMDRKGYGFVTFADPKDAMKFLETRVHELKGRRLDAKAAVPKAQLGTAKLTKKMFVGGTGDLTDDDFNEHFSQFGDIEDAAVVRREGMSRGFGFVTFADEISVEKCLLVNHFIKGRKVELKRAVPKEDLGPAAVAGGIPAAGPAPLAAPLGAAYPAPQQLYPYPYAPGPYAVRPGAYPGAAPMQPIPGPMGDPYAAWYGMGYVPYYPAGMYPPPYGVMPQPGVPYAGVAYAAPPGMTPAAAAAATQARLPRGTILQEEVPFLQAPRTGTAAARGPGRPPAGFPGAAGPSSTAAAAAEQALPGTESAAQLQATPSSPHSSQQQAHELAGSPAGAADTPERAAASEGPQHSSSSSYVQQVHQTQLPGGVAGMVLPGQPAVTAASPISAGRRPVVVAYPLVPGVMMRPQPLPLPPRGMMGAPAGPGPAPGLTGHIPQVALPGRVQLPAAFARQQQAQQRGPGSGGSSTGGAAQLGQE